jgi:hypothetical protein
MYIFTAHDFFDEVQVKQMRELELATKEKSYR